MNGVHDMGGMHGFGAVLAEQDEPAFHADWQRRVLALTVAMGASGEWNLDASRFARENRAPGDYLGKSHYEIWLAGLQRLLAERELVSEDEISAGRALEPRRLFNVGDHVTAKNINPPTHTRLPRYVRGHIVDRQALGRSGTGRLDWSDVPGGWLGEPVPASRSCCFCTSRVSQHTISREGTHGNRNRQMVQRRQGLRLHHA
jgi:Nitrile hydratase beta subunit, N-terminal/Nitrile hydratase beta subunit, C-terminal